MIASLLLLAYLLAPGVIIHSLGILSENLYLLVSLAALLSYLHIRNRQDVAWSWYLGLTLLLAAAVLTRTVGVALIAAFLVTPLLDRELNSRQRLLLPGLAVLAIVIWRTGTAIQGQEANLDYEFYLGRYFDFESGGVAGILQQNFESVRFDLVKMLSAWNHYIFLSHDNLWFFVFSYALLICCAVGLGLRAAKLKLDAIYVLFYIGAILVWRHPEQMVRFLHPVIFLFMVQPVLYLTEQKKLRVGQWISRTVMAVLAMVVIHEGFVQTKLIRLQAEARSESPEIANSFEHYDGRSGLFGEDISGWYAVLFQYMAASAGGIPESSVVAALKHEHYSVLSDRKAVTLSAVVSHEQQLCNFLLRGVDVVFLSNLISPMNMRGMRLLDDYRQVTSEVSTMVSPEGIEVAKLLFLDRGKIEEELAATNYNCREYREMP